MLLQAEHSDGLPYLFGTGAIAVVCCLLGICFGRYRWHKAVVGIIAVFLLLSAVYEVIYGLLQIYGNGFVRHRLYPLTGTFFNPAPYAGWLATILPLSLYYMLYFRTRKTGKPVYRYCYVVLSCITFFIVCLLPATMSRTAWCAAVISSLFVLACDDTVYRWVREHLRSLKRKKWLVSIAIVFLFILSLGVYGIKKDSADGRLFIWKISLEAIWENPRGYGAGKFAEVYGETQENDFASGDYSSREEWVAGCPEYAFNEYLRIAVEYGVIFLGVVLALMIYCLWEGFRFGRIGFCGVMISLSVFSFASYPFSLPEFWLLLFLSVVALLYDTSFRGRIFLLLVLFCGVVWGVKEYKNMHSAIPAREQWRQASYFYRIGDYAETVEAYAGLETSLHDDYRFMFEYGHALHKIGRYGESTRVLQKAMEYSCDPMILNIIGKNYQALGDYDVAEYWYIRSVHRLPNRHYPYYLLAKLYADPAFYQPDKMQKMITIVIEKKPKVHSSAINEMREELSRLSEKSRVKF